MKRAVAGLAICALAVALLSGLIWFNGDWLLERAARIWVVSDPVEPADAIVILGGRSDLRPEAGAKLYKSGLATVILVSSSIVGSAQDVEILRRFGVPATSIVTIGHELATTYAEAAAVRAWAEASDAQRIIIPTDLFATRRTQWIFNRVLAPTHVTVMIEAVEPRRQYALGNWWRPGGRGINDFANEVLKYGYYRLVY